MKPHSTACDRNQQPILEVLREHFADRRRVLEIGSGTGQHAVHFAAGMPWLCWQCSDHADALPGIRAWLDEARLPNTPAPFALRATQRPGPGLMPDLDASVHTGRGGQARPAYDAVFSANTLHIMGWPEVEGLFAGLGAHRGRALATDLVLAVYGPFNDHGEFTSESNREFDGWLKARDPASGIRDADAVDTLARGIGLRLVADVAMPANNRTLIWRSV
ncbi:MAG: DUF938 domain-containing protein [Lysobacteraceae bacterium]|nr:MAG: DUF938 domain-containing protein [Xanthomonadaceae bacterium]